MPASAYGLVALFSPREPWGPLGWQVSLTFDVAVLQRAGLRLFEAQQRGAGRDGLA